MTEPDRKVWLDALSYLRTHHPDICRQWFEDLEPVGTEGGVFIVVAPQEVRRRYLERECTEHFNDAIQSASGRLLSVRFTDTKPAPPEPKPTVNGSIRPATPPRRVSRNGAHDSLVISPDYTFENFIVGPENRMAHAAALAVCDAPGSAYNPLFLHGGVGLGKTHLLQAVCQHLLAQQPDLAIHYVSCDGFMTQFIEAVQAGQMADFRHRFRDIDLLAIDDIHCLAQRDRTQEEFFHTFNALYQAGKQIILSSDSPPQDIPDLEARLVSRFQCGMIAEVSSPTYDTRVQIVRRKASIRGLDFPDDVACAIASRVTHNVRELEGAVVRVHMHHVADGEAISPDLVRKVLTPQEIEVKPEPTITAIIDAVVEYYGVKLADLQSKRRQKSIAHPRQVCMYLAREHTRYSLEEIGGYFGGRDHTTVMHAVAKVKQRRAEDEEFGRVLDALEARLR